MKRFQKLLILVAMVLLSRHAGAEVKIGVSLPLTGVAAAYGSDIRRILEYLNERGPRFRLIIEDDKCDPKEAVAIAQRFITLEHVSMVLGLPCSGTVLSTAQIYENAATPLIAIGPGAPRLSGLGKWIFRSRPSDEGSVCLLGKHVGSKHKKVSIVAEQTEFAQALADFFTRHSGFLSDAVIRRDYSSADSDFQTLFLKVKGDKSEAVVLFSQGEPTLSRLVKAVRALGIQLPIYSATFPGSPTFLRLTGPDAEGIVFSVLAPKESMLTTAGLELLNAFEQLSGPLNTLDYGFAVTETALTAAVSTLQQTKNYSEYLHSTTFNGSIGNYSFNIEGDLIGMRYVLQRITNGKPVTLDSGPQYDTCMQVTAAGGHVMQNR